MYMYIQPSGKVSICVPLFMELHSVPVKFNLQIEPLIVHQLHNLAERGGEREVERGREREREGEREGEGERGRGRGRERSESAPHTLLYSIPGQEKLSDPTLV